MAKLTGFIINRLQAVTEYFLDLTRSACEHPV
jgi:hypothetical protein